MKILLDTDIGSDIDDAWALGLLIASPDVELVGVTITDGDTAARAKLACKLLHVSGRDDVPVAVGRPTPPPDQVDLQFTWAEDFTAKRPVAQSAADFIVETLRAQPGEVTLRRGRARCRTSPTRCGRSPSSGSSPSASC